MKNYEWHSFGKLAAVNGQIHLEVKETLCVGSESDDESK